VDEAFIDFAGEEESLVRAASESRRLIVIRSLTKFYALPGLRIGYLVTHPETVAALERHQPPWSVNAIAQEAGIAAIEDLEFADFTRRFIRQAREELRQRLPPSLPSTANFLLCHVPQDVVGPLRQRGIAIRDCSTFTGLTSEHIRISVRKRSDNNILASALKEILHG
jgi:threonine-phosphate decarboxylase